MLQLPVAAPGLLQLALHPGPGRRVPLRGPSLPFRPRQPPALRVRAGELGQRRLQALHLLLDLLPPIAGLGGRLEGVEAELLPQLLHLAPRLRELLPQLLQLALLLLHLLAGRPRPLAGQVPLPLPLVAPGLQAADRRGKLVDRPGLQAQGGSLLQELPSAPLEAPEAVLPAGAPAPAAPHERRPGQGQRGRRRKRPGEGPRQDAGHGLEGDGRRGQRHGAAAEQDGAAPPAVAGDARFPLPGQLPGPLGQLRPAGALGPARGLLGLGLPPGQRLPPLPELLPATAQLLLQPVDLLLETAPLTLALAPPLQAGVGGRRRLLPGLDQLLAALPEVGHPRPPRPLQLPLPLLEARDALLVLRGVRQPLLQLLQLLQPLPQARESRPAARIAGVAEPAGGRESRLSVRPLPQRVDAPGQAREHLLQLPPELPGLGLRELELAGAYAEEAGQPGVLQLQVVEEGGAAGVVDRLAVQADGEAACRTVGLAEAVHVAHHRGEAGPAPALPAEETGEDHVQEGGLPGLVAAEDQVQARGQLQVDVPEGPEVRDPDALDAHPPYSDFSARAPSSRARSRTSGATAAPPSSSPARTRSSSR